ncbi:DUF3052 domain-containing protein [Bacillus sp. PS06]|uniref:DUF3052 domain-containing protein n=1 Tax=Bacillus sp. PS06 TaxID=2764176 RepID=UPI00177DB54E|nr:DUF3052 domain-containing protein [Bacillus sp. PS06]MBD8067943.1 DUF3052 domain-containing protein [Bacillus sp. PS06]
MSDAVQVLKKLQFKEAGQPVLIIHSPTSYEEIIAEFQGDVHREAKNDKYQFIQVFGTTNVELQSFAQSAVHNVETDGLLWLCYPKKSSKTYKGSDCSRETVTGMLSNEGYEPVRQIAIDEDWSALRFRKTENIKKMTRKFAVTEEGIERTTKQ